MRNFLNAVVACLIPVVVFVGVRRLHIPQGGQISLIFLAAVPPLVWAAKQEATADRLKFQRTAATFGFQPADRDEVSLAVYPLRAAGWVEGAASGEVRGLKAWLFNYSIRDDHKNIRQTVVAFNIEGASLPIFQIRPLGQGAPINDWENRSESVCFPDALYFHRRFELLSSAEEGVRRHFNAKLLDAIAALNDCNYIVQGYYTSVLVFTYRQTLPRSEQMEALARKGADIASAIFSTEKCAMAAVATHGCNSAGA